MAKGGFRGGQPNMNNMMKQMRKMQEEMEKTQADIEEREFESTSGGGVVKATVNGKREVVSLKIETIKKIILHNILKTIDNIHPVVYNFTY